MKPLITIIIPVFNAEKYIERCIESVTSQTYKNLEIFLINDGSKDNSGRICDKFALKDNRIRVIHQENSGPSIARNKALDLSKGEYIGFVDSDDYIDIKMFEILQSLCQKHSCDISCCNLYLSYESKNEIPEAVEHSIKIIKKNDAVDFAISKISFGAFLCNKLFKKDLFKTFRLKEKTFYEDFDAGIKLISSSNKIIYTPEPLYFYTQTNHLSTTHTHNTIKIIDHFNVAKDILSFCISNNFTQASKNAKIRLLSVSVSLIKSILLNNELKIYSDLFKEIKFLLKQNILFYLKTDEPFIKKIFIMCIIYCTPAIKLAIKILRGKK